MDYMRQRYINRLLRDADPGGGGGTAVITPGTPAAFSQGASDAPTGAAPVETVIVVDTPTQHAAPGTPGATFTVEQLEDARRQERDKLYGTLQSTQGELSTLRAEKEARERAEKDAKDRADAAEREAAQADMDAKQLIAAKEQEWGAQLAEVREEARTTRALFERERTHSELQAHRFAVMNAAQEDILPQFIDLVTGNTVDEINASAEMLKQKSASVLADMNAVTQNARQNMQGTTATAPLVGPADNVTATRQFTAEEISQMSDADYAKYRPQLLAGASQAAFAR